MLSVRSHGKSLPPCQEIDARAHPKVFSSLPPTQGESLKHRDDPWVLPLSYLRTSSTGKGERHRESRVERMGRSRAMPFLMAEIAPRLRISMSMCAPISVLFLLAVNFRAKPVVVPGHFLLISPVILQKFITASRSREMDSI